MTGGEWGGGFNACRWCGRGQLTRDLNFALANVARTLYFKLSRHVSSLGGQHRLTPRVGILTWAALLLVLGITACSSGAPDGAVVDRADAIVDEAETPAPKGLGTPEPTRRPSPTPDPTPRPTPTPTPTPTAEPVAIPAGAVATQFADQYIGQYTTVCGTVATAVYATAEVGTPTFLNFDRPHPDQSFTVVIWPDTRGSYVGAPEVLFAGQDVCVDGVVSSYGGKPQIEAGWGAVALLSEWQPVSAAPLDCAGITDPAGLELCLEIQAELNAIGEDAYWDAMDDIAQDP